MATMSHTTENKVRPVKSNGNLTAMLKPEHVGGTVSKQDRVLHIANLLQTSLDAREILAQFGREITDEIAHDNLSYVHEKQDINLVLGERERHSCTYELTVNDMHLGILSLTRKTAFTSTEIERLESLICAVHYPLRNALLYSEAVNAAHRDALTGVGNRASLNVALRREIEKAFRHSRSLGIIMMDVDHFKSVNDAYGHAAGDLVLQSLVECAEQSVRISDMVFRYGGEEFLIILPETDEAGVLRLAKRIRRRVEKLETVVEGQTINITASLGITTLKDTDDDKSLIARADEVLYQAKREGRNCIRIADEV